MGLEDELGSGMRNTYKYTKLYSGGIPEFCEGDMFKITIPLKQTTEQVSKQVTGQDAEQKSRHISGQMTGQDAVQDTVQDAVQDTVQDTVQVIGSITLKDLLEYCSKPRTRQEMQDFCGLAGRNNFARLYIRPLLKEGKLIMTIPDKPHSKNQKYVTKKD